MNKYYWGTKQYHLFQMYSSGLHLREILFLHTSTPLWKRIRFWVYYLLSAYPAFSESAADLFIPDMSRTVPFNSILMYQANRSFILPRWKHFCFCFPMTIGFYVLVWLHFTVLWVWAKLGKMRLGLSSSPQVFESLVWLCIVSKIRWTSTSASYSGMSPHSFCCFKGCRMSISVIWLLITRPPWKIPESIDLRFQTWLA